MANNVQFDTTVVTLVAGYKDSQGVIHSEAEIREMNGVDEEDIQKSDVRSNIGRIVTRLLANCVVRIGSLEKSQFKAAAWEKIMQELYLGDRDLLMMEIRKFTYGGELEVPFQCPHCKAQGKHIMEWDEVEIKPVSGDPASVPFELKKGAFNDDGERVNEGTLRMPIGQDQELLDGVARKNLGQANTALITRCVTSLGDIKLSAPVFKNLSVADREAIVTTISENNFGPDFKQEIECPTCGEKFDTGVHPVNFL